MKSRNASACSFGWDFQSNAAIVLMLKNIKSAVSVKVEGGTEDVEIALDNGDTLYCQAKAVFRPDDSSHVREKLKDGLATLHDAAAFSDVEKLLYITNSPNPFNDVATMPFFYGWTSLSFDELPGTCKQAILDMITAYTYDNIDTKQYWKLGSVALPSTPLSTI